MADHVYCSEGCYEDCLNLLANFEKKGTLSFEAFAEEWRKMHFDLVFSGRQDGCELVNFTRQIIDIAKSFIFTSTNKSAIQIGAIYLCYGLFYKQQCNAQVKLIISI